MTSANSFEKSVFSILVLKVNHKLMTRFLLVFFVLMAYYHLQAQANDWENPFLTERNAYPKRASVFSFGSEGTALDGDVANCSRAKSLNGMWQFYWLKKPEDVPPDFWDMNYNFPDRINVPSNWVVENYGIQPDNNTAYPWGDSDFPNIKHYNPTGLYKTTFTVPEDWAEMDIHLYFEGVASAMYLWINGQQISYHQGIYKGIEFDITKYLQRGLNTLVVQVMQWSDASYLQSQKEWQIGGIFKDVWLITQPPVSIHDVIVSTVLDSTCAEANLFIRPQIVQPETSLSLHSYSIRARLYNASANVISEQTQSLSYLLTSKKNSLNLTVETSKIERTKTYYMILTLKDINRKWPASPLVESRVYEVVFDKCDWQ